MDTSAIVDRRAVIEQHNLLLLSRLEKIHQHHVPKQFDVSHLSEQVLNAPRHSNAARRRREQLKIEEENARMNQRMQRAKGSACCNKQLARDADTNRYLAEQISKVARRRKVRELCQSLSDHHQISASKLDLVHQRRGNFDFDFDGHRHGLRGGRVERIAEVDSREDSGDDSQLLLRGCQSLSRLDRHKAPGFAHAVSSPNFEKLPLLHPPKQQPHATLAHTTKLISALDLLR